MRIRRNQWPVELSIPCLFILEPVSKIWMDGCITKRCIDKSICNAVLVIKKFVTKSGRTRFFNKSGKKNLLPHASDVHIAYFSFEDTGTKIVKLAGNAEKIFCYNKNIYRIRVIANGANYNANVLYKIKRAEISFVVCNDVCI